MPVFLLVVVLAWPNTEYVLFSITLLLLKKWHILQCNQNQIYLQIQSHWYFWMDFSCIPKASIKWLYWCCKALVDHTYHARLSNRCSFLFLIPFLVWIRVVFQECCQLSEICLFQWQGLDLLGGGSEFQVANWMIHEYTLKQPRQQFFYARKVFLCMLVKIWVLLSHLSWSNRLFTHQWIIYGIMSVSFAVNGNDFHEMKQKESEQFGNEKFSVRQAA